MRLKLQTIFLLVLLLSLEACNSLPLNQRSDVLRDTLRRYEVTLRWDSIANAYAMLTPEKQKTTTIPSHLDNIKITHYEVLVRPQIKDNRAVQEVRIRYIHKDRQIVRQIVDHQIWIDIPDVGWRRDNPIPSF